MTGIHVYSGHHRTAPCLLHRVLPVQYGGPRLVCGGGNGKEKEELCTKSQLASVLPDFAISLRLNSVDFLHRQR